jgi:glycosyltransferase involved in cell wall biosynthesis
MRVVIASTCVPHIDGGGRFIVHWTADAMRERGHEVEELLLPFPGGIHDTLPAMVGLRALPLAGQGDRLIAIRWPAHLIRHENKATWFIHHYRQLFDLWDSEHRPLPANAEARAYREHLRRIDDLGFAESRDVFTNSLIVRDRVRLYNGIEAEPLFPPLGGDTSKLRNEDQGDYVVYASRITTIKRQHLAIEAMAHSTSGVRLLIAGHSESPEYERRLRDLVHEHGLEDRVELRFGWMEEAEKVALINRALAVAYLPFDEDSYGYPSLEASHAGKPIVTLSDSGGALEFVRDGVEGLVSAPDPRALALAFDQLHDDRAGAERMGERSARRRSQLGIDWDHTVARLLGDPPPAVHR